MKLSLQKRVNYLTVQDTRKVMIKTENLHISDSITYEEFFRLYQKYSYGISEVEFAKYFLDIDWRSFYNLQTGRRETSVILEREFYADSEFDIIQERIVSEEGLKPNDKINYDKLLELHQKYGDRFPLRQFAYEVLNINAHAVGDMNYRKNLDVAVLRPHGQTRNQISRIKANVVKNSGLHIEDVIDYTKFQEIYIKYGEGIDERDFALRILGITNDMFTRFKSGRRPVTTVFSTFPLDYKFIAKLREKVIAKEGLYIEQAISNEKFLQLYEKYGGILPETLFAEEILDINTEALRQSQRRNENNIILTGIELSEQYIIQLQKKIIKENGIQPNNQLMSLSEMNQLRKQYAPMLTEKRFITLIMGVKYENYIQLALGTTQRNYVFAIQPTPEIQKIREKVIREQKLHYDDTIDYYSMHALHQKYAPTMREHAFARYILDINQISLDNIRSNKGVAYTHILLDEVLPTEKEIDEIRKRLLSDTKIRNAEKIDYKSFEILYSKYGGVMPEDMFSLQVLEIAQKELNRMKQNSNFQAEFLMRGKQDWKEGKYKTSRKKTKTSERLMSNSGKLEERAIKVMEECIDTPKAIAYVMDYITLCEKLFANGALRPDQLKTFADAIIYDEAERKHIEIFARACVAFEEYDFCSRNISRNLESNENLNKEDKVKLRSFQDNVRYALRKQRAVNLIARGVNDVNRIMYTTGALEVDILEIMNKMREGKNKDGNTFPTAPMDNGTR